MKVLTDRLLRKIEETVGDVQFCIGKRMGIRNATFILRLIMEKNNWKQKDLLYLSCGLREGFWQSTSWAYDGKVDRVWISCGRSESVDWLELKKYFLMINYKLRCIHTFVRSYIVYNIHRPNSVQDDLLRSIKIYLRA